MTDDAPLPEPSKSRLRIVVQFSIALLLLIAAGWVVVSHGDALDSALSHARNAPPALVLLAVLLPMVNLALISISFTMLCSRYARVPLSEMTALVTGAWLLNYLPMRPGLIGRIAYHRKYHAMRIADSLKVVILGITCSAIGLVVLLAIAVTLWGQNDWRAWAGACLSPIVMLGGLSFIGRLRGGRDMVLLPLVLILRYLDALVWTARYAVVFAIIGHPIGLAEAIILATASGIVQMIPLAGNGLGMREWGIGLTLAFLPSATVHTGVDPTGLAADLVNRGIEVVTAVPIGLLAIAWITRRTRNRTLNLPPDTPNTTIDEPPKAPT